VRGMKTGTPVRVAPGPGRPEKRKNESGIEDGTQTWILDFLQSQAVSEKSQGDSDNMNSAGHVPWGVRTRQERVDTVTLQM